MALAQLKTIQNTLSQEVEAFKALSKDLQTQHQARQQYAQQEQENKLVMKELALLDESANVYKLVGPAMIKQDLVEAKASVQTRIDFISGELGRLETQIKGLEEKQIRKQQDIVKMQQDAERLQQANA